MTDTTEPTVNLEDINLPTPPTGDEMYATVQTILEEARKALADEEHSVAPLLENVANVRIRDALLMHVVTEGDYDTIMDALVGADGEDGLASKALDSILNGERPHSLVDEAVAYLSGVVAQEPAAADASGEAKANLYAIGAVLAFWKNDLDLVIECLSKCNELDAGNRLGYLIDMAVSRGIRPGWVAAEQG